MNRQAGRTFGQFRWGSLAFLGAAWLALALAGGLGPAGATALKSTTQEPKFVPPVKVSPPAGTRVNVLADRLAYDSKTKVATATGLVQITYGPYTLNATKVVYDMRKDTLEANGSIVLGEPNGNVMEADYAMITKLFKEGFARHVRALLTNDVTITADYARHTEEGITYYERATYTACKTCVSEGGTPLWRIVAKTAEHDWNTRTIYYRDMTFRIGDVPVLWTPYLAYPDPSVKRRTGLLLPNLSYGSTYGFGLTTPYFVALAPNYDLTFSPKWTTRQGPVADVEWRHRLASGQYNVRGYGVHQLDASRADDESAWRGAVASKGEFKANDTWSWGWDGVIASDRTFLDSYDYDNRSMIASDAHVVGLAGRSYISAQAIHYQTTLTDEEQDLLPIVHPYVSASHIFDDAVLGGELSFDVNAYSLSRRDPETGFDLGTEQTRSVVDLRWRNQMVGGAGQVVTPFVKLRGEMTVSENVPGSATSSDTSAFLLPSAGVDVRWPFIAAHDFGQSVLTPVGQIIAAPSEPNRDNHGNEDAITLNFDTTNLFLDDRFSGYDRYEGGARVNAGLLYSLLGDNGGFIKASIGESFHVAGENSFTSGSGLNGPASDLVAALAVQPNDSLQLSYQIRVEEDLSAVNTQEISASLILDRIAGSLSYADVVAAPDYGRPNHEQQIWGDAIYRLSEGWNLFGGFRYDLEAGRFMEKSLGVEYDCDCMKARLTYTEKSFDESDIEAGKTIKLSVEFRTIGTVGGGFGF